MTEIAERSPRLSNIPIEFVRYTIGNENVEAFAKSGHDVFQMFNLASIRLSGGGIGSKKRILDFGCGAGRVMQYVPDGPEIYGCDVNDRLVEFVQESFPDAKIHQNQFTPPLNYEDSVFDLVYSYSVFSHLTEENERAWLKEFVRIGRPGCIYLVTVQGDWMIEATLSQDAQEKVRAAGFLFSDVHHRHNDPMDFPEGYESSYHTSDYVRSEWGRHFDILDIVKGEDPNRYLFDGLQFQPAGSVPRFSPMGQDLVIMRKR